MLTAATAVGACNTRIAEKTHGRITHSSGKTRPNATAATKNCMAAMHGTLLTTELNYNASTAAKAEFGGVMMLAARRSCDAQHHLQPAHVWALVTSKPAWQLTQNRCHPR